MAVSRTSALAAALTLAAGCGTTATISRHRGPTIEGTIDRSDRAALYVTTPPGPRYLIERADVVEIDHPGNVTAMVGLGYVAAGLAGLAVGYLPRGEKSGFVAIPRAMGWMGLFIGVPLTLVGGGIYLRSRGAAGASRP
jgi:hypothetical protein